MEMKKQVLSFNEFIFEAYNSYNRIMEEENKNSEEPDLSEFDWSKEDSVRGEMLKFLISYCI